MPFFIVRPGNADDLGFVTADTHAFPTHAAAETAARAGGATGYRIVEAPNRVAAMLLAVGGPVPPGVLEFGPSDGMDALRAAYQRRLRELSEENAWLAEENARLRAELEALRRRLEATGQ